MSFSVQILQKPIIQVSFCPSLLWDYNLCAGCPTAAVCLAAHIFKYVKSEGKKSFPAHVSLSPCIWKWQSLVISEGPYESVKVEKSKGFVSSFSEVVIVHTNPWQLLLQLVYCAFSTWTNANTQIRKIAIAPFSRSISTTQIAPQMPSGVERRLLSLCDWEASNQLEARRRVARLPLLIGQR